VDAAFDPQEVRQLVGLALRYPDPDLAGLALNLVLTTSRSPATLLGDAVEGAAGVDLSSFFALMRRYGQVDLLLRLLTDHRAFVRQTTAATLRWIQDPAVPGALERATADTDDAVRAAALDSFERARAAGSTVVRPLDLGAVRTPDPNLVHLLLDREIRTQDLQLMLAALNNPRIPAKLRLALASRSVRIFQAFSDRLFDALEKDPAAPSIELMGALGQLGDPRGVPYLLARSGAFRNEPMTALCSALADIGGDAAARAIVSLLGRHGAYGAPTALKRIGAAATPYLLEAYAREPELRRNSAELVAQIAGPAALKPFLAALYDTNPEVRRNAEKGLSALGEIVIEPLIQVLASEDLMPRPNAVNVLAGFSNERTMRLILDIAAEPNDIAHPAANAAIARFHGSEAIRLLERSLHSGVDRARAAAAGALARSDRPDAMALLLDAVTHGNPEVRISAIQALGEMLEWRRSPDAISVLAKALGDGDTAVARSAEMALNEVHWNEAVQILQTWTGRHSGEASLRLTAVIEKLRNRKRCLHDPDSDPHVGPPVMRMDEVRFSVAAPRTIAQGESFLVHFWAHLEELSDEVIARSGAAGAGEPIRVVSRGPVKLARDTSVRVRLSIPSFGLAGLEDVVRWTGRIGNTNFPVTVPPEAVPRTHLGYFDVFIGPLKISRLAFELTVTGLRDPVMEPVRQKVREIRARSAFASYATEDREQVLARLQGMLKVFPDLDMFLDVLALRSGEKWEQRIYEEISTREMFYLFWSIAASRSRWVESEWRMALAVRGLDYIDPVPLQPASVAPPPAELSALHFNDWTLAIDNGKSR
jgi:HEAT repeat protein